MTKSTQRYCLSSKTALYTRKYLLGPINIIIGALLIWKLSGFFFAVGILLAGIGVFYLSLRTIEFDEQFVYVGSRKYTFSQISEISGLEINMYFFPLLKIRDGKRKRWIFTDSGQAGILQILIGILVPALDPVKNLKKFTEFHKASKP